MHVDKNVKLKQTFENYNFLNDIEVVLAWLQVSLPKTRFSAASMVGVVEQQLLQHKPFLLIRNDSNHFINYSSLDLVYRFRKVNVCKYIFQTV